MADDLEAELERVLAEFGTAEGRAPNAKRLVLDRPDEETARRIAERRASDEDRRGCAPSSKTGGRAGAPAGRQGTLGGRSSRYFLSPRNGRMNVATSAASQTMIAAPSQEPTPLIVKPSEEVGDDERDERRDQRRRARRAVPETPELDGEERRQHRRKTIVKITTARMNDASRS